jgi:stage IV sporulation protein FB
MFFEPPETQYDLRWQMLGIPVRVHPWFWLMSAILGWNLVDTAGFDYLLIWMVCVFVSILLHEMGHVFMGRLFGTDGRIILYSFGGLAVGSSNLRSRWLRILVYLAGPMIQLVLAGAIWGFIRAQPMREMAPLARAGIAFLFEINLYWALFNLAPIMPLDGGRVSIDFLNWLAPDRGDYLAYGISFVCAGLFVVNAIAGARGPALIPYLPTGMWAAIMFGILAYNSFIALQQNSP